MDIYKKSVSLHKKLKGKLEINPKIKVKTKEDLSLVYTPGVAIEDLIKLIKGNI